MVDYLCWLDSVLATRNIPSDHLTTSLDWLAEFFIENMDAVDSLVIANALEAAKIKFLDTRKTILASPKSPEALDGMDEFEALLLTGNRREAMNVINGFINSGYSLVDIELHIIQPALYSIGEKWQKNQVSVAQEHMATAIVQSLMTEALLQFFPQEANNKKVLLACVENNNHDVGLRMVADALQLAGWEVQYLGANVPTSALVKQAMEWKPNLIGLSVSFPQQLKVVKQVIKQLEISIGSSRPPVIIGGLAINSFESLAHLVDADAYGVDALSAISEANRLVT
jgi:methylmalonyl-CoA mutase cobalamin-binding domain/chain